MEMKNEQSAERNAVIDKVVSYLTTYKSGFQRAAKRQKEEAAAIAEYIRIYPPSENHVRFAAEATGYMERVLSKFQTMSVSAGYDPDINNVSKNAPMTIYDLKEYVKGRFRDCECQIRKEIEAEPSVDRFVNVCEVLKKIVRLSAEDQSLLFLFSTSFVKGFELLAASQVRIGEYFSADEQKSMERACREVFELISSLYSSLGFPSGLELACGGDPACLKRIEGASAEDHWFRVLFDGDRDHAVFNPSCLAWFHSFVSSNLNRLKNVSDKDDHFTLVRDVFSGKSLYHQMLLQEEFVAYVATNKYKADEVLERINARIVLISVIMNGVFTRDWENIMREREELIARMNSVPGLTEEEERKCEERLNSLSAARQAILNVIDKAGYKLEDLLRGEVEVEEGNYVKIRKLPYPSVLDDKGDGSPVKMLSIPLDAPVEISKPQTMHMADEGGGASRIQPVKKSGRGRAARIRDEFCQRQLVGDFGLISVLSGGQTIGWKYRKQSGYCKLSSRPAILLFQELVRNCVESIRGNKKSQSIYITADLWKCFTKGIKDKNSEKDEQVYVERFFREVVLKGSKVECSDVQPEQLYLDPQLEDRVGLPVAVKYVYPVSLNPALSAQWVEKVKK